MAERLKTGELYARETVTVELTYRNGQVEEMNMERWMADLLISTIPLEMPEVERASIRPLEIDKEAVYRTTTPLIVDPMTLPRVDRGLVA